MKISHCLALLASATIAACAQTPPEQQLLGEAATAIAGTADLQTVTALVLEGEGTQYNLGQDLIPEAAGQTFAVTEYRRSMDLSQGRDRTELTRRPEFTFFQGPDPQRQVQGIDGMVAYNIAPTGMASRLPDTVAADRRAEMHHHPLVAVRAALDPAARLANLRTEGAETLLDVTTAAGQAYTLAIDTATKLPARVVTRTDNTNLGDIVIETRFDGYGDVGGFQLPARLTTKVDDFTTAEIRLINQAVNGAVDDLTAPAEAASAPAVPAPPTANVTAEELAKGIWYLAGQSHHSVLVEFSDKAVLIEAPQNDVRTLAVIAKARELLPNKPLTHVVNSHHHFDHSGGIRAAIAEGLTVVTHQANAAFFERVAARPHTIAPDALARNPQPLKLETVGQEMTLADDTMTLVLYPVTGAHSESMLMAYFPKERLLVEADVYTPGRAVSPYLAKFSEDVQARQLRVERIVPLHGAVVPFAQFEKEAAAAAAVGT